MQTCNSHALLYQVILIIVQIMLILCRYFTYFIYKKGKELSPNWTHTQTIMVSKSEIFVMLYQY